MSIPESGIQIRVREEAGIARERWPLTRGVPLPVGAVEGVDGLRLVNGAGEEVVAQFRVLGKWPDGSAKWILVDFQGDVEAGGEAIYSLKAGAAKAAIECIEITDGETSPQSAIRQADLFAKAVEFVSVVSKELIFVTLSC